MYSTMLYENLKLSTIMILLQKFHIEINSFFLLEFPLEK